MIHFIYFTILLFSVFLGVLNYKKIKHTPSFWFWMYVLFTFCIEAIAYFFQIYYSKKSNVIIYNISIPIVFGFVFLFYYFEQINLKIKKIYLVLGCVFFVLCIFKIVIENIYTFKSTIYLIMCWYFVLSAILYFLQLIIFPTEDDIISNSSFYFSGGILLLNTFLIIYMSLYPQLISTLKKINVDVSILKTTISYISYLLILYGFICLHKKTILD